MHKNIKYLTYINKFYFLLKLLQLILYYPLDIYKISINHSIKYSNILFFKYIREWKIIL